MRFMCLQSARAALILSIKISFWAFRARGGFSETIAPGLWLAYVFQQMGCDEFLKEKRLSVFDVFIRLVMLVGICLLLYPTVSSKWNDMHSSRVIAGYAHAIESITDEDYSEISDAAKAYNAGLLTQANRFDLDDDALAAYSDVLNVTGDGLMSYVEIPKLSVRLPVYHGVSEAVLQVAAGHIPGSSLPVGGQGTHCAISGHRGLTSATLFTHLDSMEVGDMFYLQTLGETLAYQVDQIDIVLPEEFDLLHIEPDGDYCTLITCTPYGINSHRMLVRGMRVEYSEEVKANIKSEESSNPVARLDMLFFWIGIGVIGIIAIVYILGKFKSNGKSCC